MGSEMCIRDRAGTTEYYAVVHNTLSGKTVTSDVVSVTVKAQPAATEDPQANKPMPNKTNKVRGGKLPKTGDSANMAVASVMGIAGVALALAAVDHKRKNH